MAKEKAAATAHPFRDAMFLLVVRNNVANGLVSNLGYSRSEARAASHELADSLIEEAANKVAADNPTVPVNAAPGGILAFLMSFLSSPLFQALITMLLSLFGGTTTAPVATDTPA